LFHQLTKKHIMEKMKGQMVVNLVTSSEEFAKLLKSMIDKSLEEFKGSFPKQEVEDELVTIKNAALFFQVSETTIHAWKNTGILPFIKINSRIRFKKSEILALYEKRRNKTQNFHH